MRKISSMLAAGIVVCLAAPVSAQDLMRDMQRECTADAQRLCASTLNNPQQLIQCMVNQRAALAPGCQPVVDRAARMLGIAVPAQPATPPTTSTPPVAAPPTGATPPAMTPPAAPSASTPAAPAPTATPAPAPQAKRTRSNRSGQGTRRTRRN